MDYVALFARGSLTDFSNLLANALASNTQSVVQAVQTWDPDKLPNTPDEDVIERLVKQGSVRCPQLLTDQAEQLDPTEADKTVIEFGERVTRRVTRLILAVPYEGEREVFLLRADTSSTNNPRVLRLTDKELHLAVDDPPGDAAQIKAMFEAQIAHIEQYLGWSRQQIDRHNQQIQEQVPRLLAQRREQLRATRDLQGDIGYPVRGRPDRQGR